MSPGSPDIVIYIKPTSVSGISPPKKNIANSLSLRKNTSIGKDERNLQNLKGNIDQ